MFVLVVYFLISECHKTISQFPEHVDLHKVGEVTFQNEKYNVLRPSLHLVKDYFKDFMLRRDTSNFPTKRVFVDKSGFRHYWTGLESFTNFRKSSLLDVSNATTLTPEEGVNTTGKADLSTKPTRKKPKRKKPLRDGPLPPVFLRASGNRTVAVTTFFCPFFGVVNMTTFLD